MQLSKTSTSSYVHLDTPHNWDCMRVPVGCIPLHSHHTVGQFDEMAHKLSYWSTLLVVSVADYRLLCVYFVDEENHSCRSRIRHTLIYSQEHKSHSGRSEQQKFVLYRCKQSHQSFDVHIGSGSGCCMWTRLDMYYHCYIESSSYWSAHTGKNLVFQLILWLRLLIG